MTTLLSNLAPGRLVAATGLVLLGLAATAAPGAATASDLFVRLETDAGQILLNLDRELAPHHVDQFVHLSRTDFYNGTAFHRIVPGFVIQGGDPNTKDADPGNDGQGYPTYRDVLTAEEYAHFEALRLALEQKGYTPLPEKATLKGEFRGGGKHVPSALSMARRRDPNSAGSQFFICVGTRPDLDGSYTVFGHVVQGMDVVQKIVDAPQTGPRSERPVQPVRIRRTLVLTGTAELTEAELKAWQEMQ